MMIRVATVQFEPRPGADEYNFERVEHFARAAAGDAVQLIAFPELCLVGNRHLARRSPEYLRALAEPENGPSIARVSAMAQRLRIGIGVGLLTGRDGCLFNSYAVCLPDGNAGIIGELLRFARASTSRDPAYAVPWPDHPSARVPRGSGIVMMAETQCGTVVSRTCRSTGPARHDGSDGTDLT